MYKDVREKYIPELQKLTHEIENKGLYSKSSFLILPLISYVNSLHGGLENNQRIIAVLSVFPFACHLH